MKVLFLGNSHTFFNDMPMIFKNICKEKNKDVEISMQAHPGVTYSWHLNQLSELRFAFMHENFDFIVMQQAAHSPCPEKEETLKDAKSIIDFAKNFGVKPLQIVPWAQKAIPGNQEIMYDIYSSVAKENNIELVKAGNIFEDIFQNHKDIDMYWFDGEHASAYGSYAIALSVYSAIFKESVKDVSNNSFYTYIVSDENKEKLLSLKNMHEENPDDDLMKNEYYSFYKKTISPSFNKEEIKYTLDESKANIIKDLVDKHCL